MSDIVRACRHPKEKVRGVLSLLIGALIWAAFAYVVSKGITSAKPHQAILFLSYLVAFLVLGFVSAAFARAHAFAYDVLIGERQFPHLHRMIADGAAELGMKRVPRAFISNSHGIFNAFARRLLGGRYVFLTGALVQAETDAQLRFIIGHELGHHAAGHLDFGRNLLRAPSRLVPFLYPAYSRGRELTCDRIGTTLSADLEASRSALQMLACGCARLNDRMDADAFEAQEDMVPPIAGFLLKAFATHPHTCARVRALRRFAPRSHPAGPTRQDPVFSA